MTLPSTVRRRKHMHSWYTDGTYITSVTQAKLVYVPFKKKDEKS